MTQVKKKTARKKTARKKTARKKTARKRDIIKKEDINSYKDFLEFLKQNNIKITKPKKQKSNRYYRLPHINEEYVYVQWSTGGVSGGSCYGGENVPYTNHYYDDRLAELEDILLLICPELSYLKFRKIENTVVEKTSWSENEYYGNSTDFVMKYVILRKLYEELTHLKKL